jgi:hypothetical protein
MCSQLHICCLILLQVSKAAGDWWRQQEFRNSEEHEGSDLLQAEVTVLLLRVNEI